jgi:hypothetical protein
MSLSRAIPIQVHGAIEVLAAAMLIAAPFVLGFPAVAGAVSLAIGVVLIGLALSIDDERRPVPLRAHAEIDHVIAAFTIVSGIALGIATGDLVVTVFMAGFGSAHFVLTSVTRFSRPIGA